MPKHFLHNYNTCMPFFTNEWTQACPCNWQARAGAVLTELYEPRRNAK
jgi:hypothetical protein